MNQVKIGNILKTMFIRKNKEHRKITIKGGKENVGKLWKLGSVNIDVDLKEDRDIQETMVLYCPVSMGLNGPL